ncbi:MAG: response regulator [Lachnospiraceae bacterium]|nr:response regulator [Lachnospiraceae bacterium]
MGKCVDLLKRFKEYIVPKDAEIQVAAFNILALCGILVSSFVALYNLFVGFRVQAFFECLTGVLISYALIIYTKKTGNYRRAMILTVLIIFIGLFSVIYLASGGFYAGVPFFFVFATVFTAFLLDGVVMAVLVILELSWYAALSLYTYYYPEVVKMNATKEVFIVDAVVCETAVSISLAITMYFQIRLYRKKQQELNVAVQTANEANRAKSDFLAKMSHDIRTPLNTIMAMNELIVANTSSAKIREWVNDSNVSSRILMSLINDMLDLTRIEAGKMEFLDQPWDTASLFDEIARAWRMQADKAGLFFNYDLDEKIPEQLIGDEDVIRKIANNLLSNSIKYTKTGSITFAVGMKERDLIITVSDTGIGIAPEYLENIFRPFERGAQTVYKETSGSGLGLSIVKELVDALHGTIDCKSIVDEGTTFTVCIPQKQSASDGDIRKADNPKTIEYRPDDKFIAADARILVVDDNPSNRKVIEAFLEPTLIRIDDVESGFEALEMLDIKEYDLVLMDLRMPKMDGAETLEKIKEEFPSFDTPVVVLTADIMNDVKDKMLELGFADFLAKPVSSGELLGIVKKYISEKIIPVASHQEMGLTLAKIESYQALLMPYGIDLSMALEFNAGNADEFFMRAGLFEQYADDTIASIENPESSESYYLQVHSIKSIARGVGAYLLAQLTEADEFRNDHEFSDTIRKVIVDEYQRARRGLEILRKEVETL